MDTKQTKTIGEHHVAAELARRNWAPALTRDGLARTDILAVRQSGGERNLVEIQVKAARGPKWESITWLLGRKSQTPSLHDSEYFVLVAIPMDLSQHPRCFVVPRIHVAAAAWIQHMNWLTEPEIPVGKRNATLDQARVSISVFREYEDRWDLLDAGQSSAPILLPANLRELATLDRIGLPEGHEWREKLPIW
ncbi:hypothetical protein HQQ81_13185 [Microbacteriaceae bacterium VKM Ac-2854]|nr:hypothetical protein [Microbacteriaceae bacterium VKM Ac-2854]